MHFAASDIVLIDYVDIGGIESSRIGLVLQVYEEHSKIALCHPYPEYAVGKDLIISKNLLQTAYDLVLHADIIGVCFNSQIHSAITSLPSSIVEYAYTNVLSEDLLEHCYQGTNYSGAFDSRQVFKKSEIKTFQLICANCTYYRLSRL